MAANSFTSVSLDPPMVLLCPALSSTTWPDISRSGAFCVNVLAEHHSDITRQLALPGDRFAGVEHERRPTGFALADAVAWIECEIDAEHRAGDHLVVLARVTALDCTEGDGAEPLVFSRGRYGFFRPQAV